MNKFTVFSNAKINLGLNVYKKDEDGYHNIDTIMVPIDLEDELNILISEKIGNLKIECTDKKIPTDEKNILYKTYIKFFEKINKEKVEIDIFLKKNIPSEAGLGGGSSNAATFLKVLNEYYNNYYSIKDLEKIAFEIGSDVPFFIRNKAARISGKGEKVKLLESELDSSLILIKPDFGVSTKLAYENFDNLTNVKYSNLDKIEENLKENNVLFLEKNLENCLEQAMQNDTNLNLLKNTLNSMLPNKKFFMTGSGSTLFAFVSKNEISFLEVRLKTFLDNVQIFICNIKK